MNAMRIFFLLQLLISVLLLPQLCRAQIVELRTAETEIALEAGGRCTASSQPPGSGSAEHGKTKHPRNLSSQSWLATPRFRSIGNLIADGSQTDARNVSFVYESANPHLRLTWSWKSRKTMVL